MKDYHFYEIFPFFFYFSLLFLFFLEKGRYIGIFIDFFPILTTDFQEKQYKITVSFYHDVEVSFHAYIILNT